MNDAVKTMLNRYHCRSVSDYENALKEIIQEIALLGLWRSKFFEKAAFYGGSALRIVHGLDRFSEDLDFSLLKKDDSFSLQNYCGAVQDELNSFGFSVIVSRKEKKIQTNIDSAFIKAGTLRNMIVINTIEPLGAKIPSGKEMKIKIEIDTDPPGDFNTESKYLFQPIPFSVNIFTLPCLFAGKMHAILCRAWGKRVKGRDWYDLAWYIGMNVSVALKHLENRMRQTEHIEADEYLSVDMFKQKLRERIDSTDFIEAKKDVIHLLKDTESLNLWSKDFFNVVCEKINVT